MHASDADLQRDLRYEEMNATLLLMKDWLRTPSGWRQRVVTANSGARNGAPHSISTKPQKRLVDVSKEEEKGNAQHTSVRRSSSWKNSLTSSS